MTEHEVGVRSRARPLGAGAFLRRGMGAGLLAGLVAGAFQLVVGEPWVDEAIRLEHAAAGGGPSHELFSRAVQQRGMVLATGIYGIVLGGVVALVVYAAARRMRGTAWERSLKVAAAGFTAFWLVPFVKYPANPPAVGDPATIGVRTGSFLAMAAVSMGAWWLAVVFARRLSAQGVGTARRQLTVAGCYLLVVLAAFGALPSPEPVGVPADLLWNFRVASVGGQAVLWATTGALLGLLTERAERRAAQ
jgi:predicted cobalt transporter CbtA